MLGLYRDYIRDNGEENGDYSIRKGYIGVYVGVI